ncbi:autoinducer 2 ABC transporter substrate-binding protein [Gracilibacillus massiliensis]|uniref:autoinducer 2 ABC transporter substrate-binding protein n=1 Tax=Gracilibacillus massiliensis TaxID=1564956 RepID=UPI00071DBCB6|nr:autoinducer 2 ABC transporter substrate-binding protein [Gracilibacillus massiliensis]
MRISYKTLIIVVFVFVSACSTKGTSKEPFHVIYSAEEEVVETSVQHNEEIKIAVVPKVVNIPYFNAVEQGVKQAAIDLQVEVIYRGPTVANAEQQIVIIENLLRSESLDVLAVSANDPEALLPVMEKAANSGVQVITWDSDTLKEGRSFFINMVQDETLGRHLMDTLAWHVDEKGEFAVMTGADSAANLQEWLYWIEQQHLHFYPEMELVDIVPTNDDPQQAYAVAKQLLADHPDLDGIIGNSSVGPPAAAQAVKEENKIGEVAIVGLSSPNPMNEYLKKDIVQVVTLWSPKKLGYLTVALSKQFANGIEPIDNQQISSVGKISVNEDIVIMGEPIDFTKENVDQYDF